MGNSAIRSNYRDSGIDLVRTISVFLIVIGHLQSETNICNMTADSNIGLFFFENIIGNAERFSVNCFIMVSAWYLTGSKFSAVRFVKNWLIVFVLNLTVSILCVVLGVSTWKNIFFFQAFLPIIGRPQWYMCEYLLLLLTYPYLDIILKKIQRQQHKNLIGFGFVFIVLVETARMLSENFTTPLFSEYIWFVYVYVFVNYIKRYESSRINGANRCVYILGAIISYLGVVGMLVIGELQGSTLLLKCGNHLISDYAALPGFIYAICIFQGVRGLKISSKINERIAINSGVIYIIHSVPLLWRTDGFRIWTTVLNIEWWDTKGLLALGMIVSSIAVIVVGIFVGEVFVRPVLRFCTSRRCVIELISKMDKLYTGVV